MRTVDPEKHARKRAAILAAAAEEFAAHGFDGTSTAAICRRARIGSGTLFHYFATKRDIFHAVFSDDFEARARLFDDAVSAKRPQDGLTLLIDSLVADLVHPLAPGLMAAALLQAHRDEAFGRLLLEEDERTRAALQIILKRMKAEGRRLVFDPDRTARWILRTFDASYLASGDAGFDAAIQAAELRKIVAWLVGNEPA